MNKTKIIFIIFIGIIILIVIFIIGKFYLFNNTSQTALGNKNTAVISTSQNSTTIKQPDNQNLFKSPLPQAAERITKKPFGIYITPKNSPVQPERFQGYHTGTDFEIFPEETDAAVPVNAVCDGKLLVKKNASGYGGVAVELCELDKQPITVIYGHLDLSSIKAKTGDDIKAGNFLGNLGTAYSVQNDGERKHLHLGFHKGSKINILGYVSSQAELSSWINPCDYVCVN